MPQLVYSPWAKFCGKGKDPNTKEVCFTGKDGRTEAGQPVVAAALIEPTGEPKKLFRITLPSPLQLQYGTRVIVDQHSAPLEYTISRYVGSRYALHVAFDVQPPEGGHAR